MCISGGRGSGGGEGQENLGFMGGEGEQSRAYEAAHLHYKKKRTWERALRLSKRRREKSVVRGKFKKKLSPIAGKVCRGTLGRLSLPRLKGRDEGIRFKGKRSPTIP